jgi:hypothetical protein
MSPFRVAGCLSLFSLLFLLCACGGLGAGPAAGPTALSGTGDIHSVNHIIFMVQENGRSTIISGT